MTSYTYTFLTLRDEQVVEEIPLYGVFAQRVLNGPGQFNGTFQLDQTGKQNIDLINATTPGKTWLVMERVDSSGVSTPVWWGIVWSRTYQSQAKSCQMFAWGFEAYPQKQLILSNINLDVMGQLSIFTQLWTHMQGSAPGRNLNINIPTSLPNESVIKSVDVLASDLKYYSTPMDTLANASNGFDWTIQITKQPNNVYRKDLLLGYPVLGQLDNGSISFDYPGSILNYYKTDGMAQAGTNVVGIGAGEGSAQLVSSYEWTDLISTGFPRWDKDVSLKDIDDKASLTSLVQQEAIKRKPPMPTFVVTLKGDRDPIFGSWSLGDGCQFNVVDPLHPNGLQASTRIVGFELRPQDAGGTEEVKLILPVV